MKNEKRPAFRGPQWQETVRFVLQLAKVRTTIAISASSILRVDFQRTDRITCPEFTGSYLSNYGEHPYLSQWHKHRILKLDASDNIIRIVDIGAEISGHTFVDRLMYVLRGTEQNGESWTIARLDPREQTTHVKDIAVVGFACRSLTFDGERFWSNHRAANEIVSFRLPTESKN